MDWDSLLFNLAVFVAGLVLLELGADKFVERTAVVAKRLGLPPRLLALLTAGAEWEELAVVISALAIHQPGLALGTVLGSCITNILGVCSLGLIVPAADSALEFDQSAGLSAIVLFVATTLFVSVTWILGASAGPHESETAVVGRWVIGALLVVIFVLYATSIAWANYRGIVKWPMPDESDSDSGSDLEDDEQTSTSSSYEDHEVEHENEQSSLLNHAIFKTDIRKTLAWDMLTHVISLLVLLLAGYILSHSVTTLARTLGILATSLGLTLMAVATRLVAGSRGHQGLVVANPVASNIFLLTLCAGLALLGGGKGAGLIGEITEFDLFVVWASSGALLAVVWLGVESVRTRRTVGWVLVAAYLVFLGGELGGWGR